MCSRVQDTITIEEIWKCF
uniref:Uncharacterized protein n=1 Tax=Arundo donax TaxID=35708 RepID=A0A0A9HJ37_ARUDO